MKAGKEHRVLLSKRTVAIVTERLNEDGSFLVPGSRGADAASFARFDEQCAVSSRQRPFHPGLVPKFALIRAAPALEAAGR
jgi:hypothetical protein